MLGEIGKTAGDIWHYLEENSEASVGKLTQELKLTDRATTENGENVTA